MKPVKMGRRTWWAIRQKLHDEYPPSYFLRTKMKDKLGFTAREHTTWFVNKDFDREYAAYEEAKLQANVDEMNLLLTLPPERGHQRTEIHLDFYSENKRTMFLLKFAEELANDDKRY